MSETSASLRLPPAPPAVEYFSRPRPRPDPTSPSPTPPPTGRGCHPRRALPAAAPGPHGQHGAAALPHAAVLPSPSSSPPPPASPAVLRGRRPPRDATSRARPLPHPAGIRPPLLAGPPLRLTLQAAPTARNPKYRCRHEHNLSPAATLWVPTVATSAGPGLGRVPPRPPVSRPVGGPSCSEGGRTHHGVRPPHRAAATCRRRATRGTLTGSRVTSPAGAHTRCARHRPALRASLRRAPLAITQCLDCTTDGQQRASISSVPVGPAPEEGAGRSCGVSLPWRIPHSGVTDGVRLGGCRKVL